MTAPLRTARWYAVEAHDGVPSPERLPGSGVRQRSLHGSLAALGSGVLAYELGRAMGSWAANRNLCTIPSGSCQQMYGSRVEAQYLAGVGLMILAGGILIVLLVAGLPRLLRQKPRSQHMPRRA